MDCHEKPNGFSRNDTHGVRFIFQIQGKALNLSTFFCKKALVARGARALLKFQAVFQWLKKWIATKILTDFLTMIRG